MFPGRFFPARYFPRRYFPLGGYTQDTTRTWRQEQLYSHVCDIWRSREAINQSTGKPGAIVWTKIGSAIPCYFSTRDSLQSPHGPVLAEGENLMTTDLVHFPAGVIVDAGDVLLMTTGPEDGTYWKVRGGGKYRTRLANKLSLQATRLEAPPEGIA